MFLFDVIGLLTIIGFVWTERCRLGFHNYGPIIYWHAPPANGTVRGCRICNYVELRVIQDDTNAQHSCIVDAPNSDVS